jgi:hypothetical protein
MSLQEIVLHLAGNFVILYTGMSYNLLIVYKSVLQVEIVTYAGNLYFWILLSGREIYYLGLT